MNTETITWHPISSGPKDCMVMLWRTGYSMPWLGINVNDEWHTVNVHIMPPTHWAELLRGPES